MTDLPKQRTAQKISALLSILCALFLASCASTGSYDRERVKSPSTASLQMIVVRSAGWNARTGMLQCYERNQLGSEWRPVGEEAPVDFGWGGLAWGKGLGLGKLDPGPEKLEGDGKSPAGFFRLSAVFGYAPADSVRFLKMPYIHATTTCQCVDDPNSFYYNLVLDSLSVARADWKSREMMRQPDDSYKWGVLVDHNTNPRQAYDGSCIFLHVWAGPASPTSGCTALEESKIVSIIKWLEVGKNPLLVQMPEEQYQRLKGQWSLP